MNIIKKATKENCENKTNNLLNIIKGSIISIIFTIIALLIFSIILTNTELTENIVNPIIMLITGASIFIGSIISTSKLEKNGILNGALVGFIYILTIYLISSIINSNFCFNLSSIIIILLSIISGIIGGIIGINIKK